MEDIRKNVTSGIGGQLSEDKKVGGGNSGSRNTLWIVISVFLLVGLVWSTYGYIQATREINFLATPEGQAEANDRLVAETLEAIGKLIILPEGEETPFVFTIQNAEELAAQEPFYNKAKDGDRLIVFSDRAIIYNPTEDILVNVGPVIFQDTEDAQAPLPAPTRTPEPEPEEEEG